MSANEDIPVCTWELIEVVLSKAIEEREDEEIIDILHWFREKSSLFHSLGEDALREVVRHSHLVRTKVDHVIVHQGEKGECFYIILKGSVAVHAKKLEQTEHGGYEPVLHDVTTAKTAKERARFGQELCILKMGRCFGELSVISKNNERNATIITDEHCVLISFHRDIYKRYVSNEFVVEIVRRSSFVGTHPLFRSWPTAYRNLLAENLQMRNLKFAEVLVKQGEPLESVFFVLEGQVQLSANPVLHESTHANLLAKKQNEDSSDSEDEFDPSKPLTTIERRKLRKEMGFFACEQRYREVDICTIGRQGIIGDIEAIMELNCHTASVTCIQEMKAYEIDLSSFTKIILKKNPETNARMKRSVQEKLLYRQGSLKSALPIYVSLLTLFEKPKPKDNRRNIIKHYLAKNEKKKAVRVEFFVEMSRGISQNRNKVKEKKKPGRFAARTVITEVQPTELDGNKSSKKNLWTAGVFASKLKNKTKQHANEQPKQFTADEYKELKKKMQALGKCAANTKKLTT